MADLENKGTYGYQINEKISETQYIVLHPETDASQVIETENKKFITPAQIQQWTSSSSTGLHYKGEWGASVAYVANDVVYYGDKAFIAISSSTGQQPDDIADSVYWKNINLEAVLAEKANKVKTTALAQDSDKVLHLAGTDNVNSNTGSEYDDIYVGDVTYTPSTKTLEVSDGVVSAGELKGNLAASYVQGAVAEAVVADKYNVYASSDTTHETATEQKYINDTFIGINNRIDSIIGGTGGAVLGNSLTITKDGTNGVSFNGSETATVDIKQTYAPGDITGLLDDENKIKDSWLPSTLVGQLSYGGTFDAAGLITSSNSDYNNKTLGTDLLAVDCEGVYFMASANADNLAGISDIAVGDWILSNGAQGFIKIDNNDAVTMVNGQKGAVETYKTWAAGSVYYKGDIVKQSNLLYICNVKHSASDTFDTDSAKWDLFGKTYTATNGIKIEDDVVKHDVAVEADETVTSTINGGQALVIPTITKDAYGHITKIVNNNISLGEDFIDTVRAIKVNGTEVLAKDAKDAVNFKGDAYIQASYNEENKEISYSHKLIDSEAEGTSINSNLIETPDASALVVNLGKGFTVPSIKYDAAGHIISVTSKTYSIPNNLITHKHFNIVNGQIQAYESDVADASWVENADNADKFYAGSVQPKATSSRINYNGKFAATELYQGASKVLDNSLQISSGLKADGNEILGTYDSVSNKYTTGDSGAGAGVYSAVKINAKGIVIAGGQIVEFGTVKDAGPSDSLAVGGLFFRKLTE